MRARGFDADTAAQLSRTCHRIKRLVLAVNKMDLIGYDQVRYDAIVADYRKFADSIGVAAFVPMPISSLGGDNITLLSSNTPWYRGPTLLEHLETVEIDITEAQSRPFRMPVQWSTVQTWTFAASRD